MKSRISTTLLLSFFLCVTVSSPVFPGKFSHGFIPITDTADLFYWDFPAKTDPLKAPLVFYLMGGPGSSSVVSLFYEVGPFKIIADGKIAENPDAWNEKSNLIFVDQPLGTGFSRSKPEDYVKTEEQISSNFLIFLKGYFDKNPKLAKLPLFLAGVSFAGHYIPSIAEFLLRPENKDDRIDLRGISIGNGVFDASIQFSSNLNYALEENKINLAEYYGLKTRYELCIDFLKVKNWKKADEICTQAISKTVGNPFRFDPYDIRRDCPTPPDCFDFSPLLNLMKREDVRQELGVQSRTWQFNNHNVEMALSQDFYSSVSDKVIAVLNNPKRIRVLLYYGDKDFKWNWRGGYEWLRQLEWKGKKEIEEQPWLKWNVELKPAGEFKASGQLAFVKVFDAGHLAPLTQPHTTKKMFDQFLENW